MAGQSASRWAVPAVVAALVAGGAAYYWKGGLGSKHTLGEMARSVPGRSFACLEFDLRDTTVRREMEDGIAKARKEQPDFDKQCKDAEARLGLPLNDVLETFAVAGYAAFLPLPGKSDIDVKSADKPVDSVLVLLVDNHERAAELLKKARPTGAKDEVVDGLTFTSTADGTAVYTLSTHGLLAATSKESLQQAVAALEQHKATLAESPLFGRALKHIDGLESGAGAVGLLDGQAIWKSLSAAYPSSVDKNALAGLNSMPFLVGGFFRRDGRWRGESFLPLEGNGAPAFLKAALHPPQPSGDLAALVPSSWGLYNSLQLLYGFDTLCELVRVFPMGSTGLNMGLGQAGAVPGNPAYDLVRRCFTGQVAYTADVPAMLKSMGDSFGQARGQGQTIACKSNLKNIGTALEMYSADNGGRYPEKMQLLVGGNYLRALPTCPAAGSDTYSSTYVSAKEPDAFSVNCSGNHHAMGEGKPAYTSTEGLLADTGPAAAPAPDPVLRGAVVLGLQSVDKAAEVQAFLQKTMGFKPEALKLGSHDGFSATINGTEVVWCVMPSPPALAVSGGPQGKDSLQALLDAAADPSKSVLKQSDYASTLAQLHGTPVASQYLDMRSFLEFAKNASSQAKNGHDPLASFDLSQIGPEAGFTAVEGDGIRFVTTGGGAGVVATVAVGAAILVPNFLKARGQGQLTACKSNEKNMATALEMYASDHGGRYPTKMSQLQPDYLKTVPTCPAAGTDTYSGSYQMATSPDSFTFFCAGNNHANANTPPDYPQYSAMEGLRDR